MHLITKIMDAIDRNEEQLRYPKDMLLNIVTLHEWVLCCPEIKNFLNVRTDNPNIRKLCGLNIKIDRKILTGEIHIGSEIIKLIK